MTAMVGQAYGTLPTPTNGSNHFGGSRYDDYPYVTVYGNGSAVLASWNFGTVGTGSHTYTLNVAPYSTITIDVTTCHFSKEYSQYYNITLNLS